MKDKNEKHTYETTSAGLGALFLHHAATPNITNFCETCGVEWHMPLVSETARTETYQCPGCGRLFPYTVR